MNGLDRPSSGFLVKKFPIFPKIILQSKERARARAKLPELQRGTRATSERRSRCRIWSHRPQKGEEKRSEEKEAAATSRSRSPKREEKWRHQIAAARKTTEPPLRT
jgi:hypothetical protein